MTSLLSVSSTARAKLEAQAKKLKGTLTVTLHKAQHLKNISLFGSGSGSDPFAVLRVGGSGGAAPQTFQSVVARRGGPHPLWEQQFVFQIGAPDTNTTGTTTHVATPATTATAATGADADDGALHVRLYDRNSPSCECIGRVDVNFIQLLEAGNGSPATDDDAPSDSAHTRWHRVCDARNLDIQAGWLCLTASFVGTGLQPSDASATNTTTGAKSTTAAQKLLDGSYPIADSSSTAAASAAALPAADSASSDQRPSTASSTFSPTSLADQLLYPLAHLLSSTTPSVDVVVVPATHVVVVPPPSDASSAYYAPPASGWPTPRKNPPAPGYASPEPMRGPPPTPSTMTVTATATSSTFASPRRAATASGAAPGTGRSRAVTPLQTVRFSAETAGSGAEDNADTEQDEDESFLHRLPDSQQQQPQQPPHPVDALVTAYDARHPEHILVLQARVARGRFLCAACGQEGHGAAFHCTEGCDEKFELHESCLQPLNVSGGGGGGDEDEEAEEGRAIVASPASAASPRRPDMHVDPRHAHPLTWTPHLYEGSYLCNGCGGGGSGAAWHCLACSWDLHPECAR